MNLHGERSVCFWEKKLSKVPKVFSLEPVCIKSKDAGVVPPALPPLVPAHPVCSYSVGLDSRAIWVECTGILEKVSPLDVFYLGVPNLDFHRPLQFFALPMSSFCLPPTMIPPLNNAS